MKTAYRLFKRKTANDRWRSPIAGHDARIVAVRRVHEQAALESGAVQLKCYLTRVKKAEHPVLYWSCIWANLRSFALLVGAAAFMVY
jgi:hypothetical protein